MHTTLQLDDEENKTSSRSIICSHEKSSKIFTYEALFLFSGFLISISNIIRNLLYQGLYRPWDLQLHKEVAERKCWNLRPLRYLLPWPRKIFRPNWLQRKEARDQGDRSKACLDTCPLSKTDQQNFHLDFLTIKESLFIIIITWMHEITACELTTTLQKMASQRSVC